MRISGGLTHTSLVPGLKVMNFSLAARDFIGSVGSYDNKDFDSLTIVGSSSGNNFEIARLSENI